MQPTTGGEPTPYAAPVADAPYGSPPVSRADLRRSLTRQTFAALVLLATGAAVGVLAGVAWSVLADRVKVVITPQGPDLNSYATNEFFASDGMYVTIATVGGLVLGAVAYTWRRQRGAVVLVGTVLGAAVAGLVCWQLGRHIGLAHYHQQLQSKDVGLRFVAPVRLRSTIALLLWPLAAAAAYTVCALFSGGEDLHYPERDRPSPDPDRPPAA